MELRTEEGGVRAHRQKARTTEKKGSGWNTHKMVLDEKDVEKFLEKAQQNTGKENGLNDHHSSKADHKKVSMYPTPGNILYTGRQIPRTPGPGVLPLLPSQIFSPNAANLSFETLYRSLSHNSQKAFDNRIPGGKQLERTVVLPDPHEVTDNCDMKEMQTHVNSQSPSMSFKSAVNGASDSLRLSITQESAELCKQEQENVHPKVKRQVNQGCVSNGMTDCRQSVNYNRRISELPVKGLNPLRISGLLRNLPGYECRNEDLEFLNHMGKKERAKMLKAELLSLRRELTASRQDKELAVAKKEKIDCDIQNMRHTFERTVHLGRAFLCRTSDLSAVSALSDEDVLKRLNPMSIRLVLEEERLKLLSAHKELAKRKQDSSTAANRTEKDMRAQTESCNLRIKEAQLGVLKLQDEINAFQQQVEKTQKEVAETEDRLQKKREQIQSCVKPSPASEETHSLTESDRERVERRLQRIVRRKELYLERERMLGQIKRNLQ